MSLKVESVANVDLPWPVGRGGDEGSFLPARSFNALKSRKTPSSLLKGKKRRNC